MFNRMLSAGSGGGNLKEDSFTVNSTSQVSVDVPFAIRKLFIYHVAQPNNYNVEIYYDGDMSPTIQYRSGYAAGAPVYDTPPIPNTSIPDAILSITSNGFTYIVSNSVWFGEYKYIAIG